MDTWNSTVMDLIIVYQVLFPVPHLLGQIYFPSSLTWVGPCDLLWSKKHDRNRGMVWLIPILLAFTMRKTCLRDSLVQDSKKNTD